MSLQYLPPPFISLRHPRKILAIFGFTTSGGNYEWQEETSSQRNWQMIKTLRSPYLDEHTRLVIGVGGEGLSLLGGNGGVALDENSHDTSSGLNTQRQRCHIQEQQVLHVLRLVT